MELQGDSMDPPIEASLKKTYRALLARGLEAGEAANLTAFLHGLPSDGFHWTLPEVEAVLRRRLAHAAALRAAETANPLRVPVRRARSTIHDRRTSGAGFTHVIDPPKP
jgi:predicted phage gp36 major capsid-like protein